MAAFGQGDVGGGKAGACEGAGLDVRQVVRGDHGAKRAAPLEDAFLEVFDARRKRHREKRRAALEGTSANPADRLGNLEVGKRLAACERFVVDGVETARKPLNDELEEKCREVMLERLALLDSVKSE